MKKFLSFLAVATFVVALSSCGSKTEAPAEGTTDTAAVAAEAAPAMDTTAAAVDTAASTVDTAAAH
jgi:predicted small lipoprotein YifL